MRRTPRTGSASVPRWRRALFAAGADVITLGNHAWDRKEIIPYIADTPRLIRPLNFPPGTPGNGAALVEVPGGRRALVLQAMGRLYMDPLDCPFRGTSAELAKHRLGVTVAAIVVDFHAEASSEKMAFAHFLDGTVSLVVGTHTHCPSADAQVLPGGSAFQSDAGMSGDYDSVIGMQKDAATLRFWRKMPGERLSPAEGEATVCGVFVETDDAHRPGEAGRAGALRRTAGGGDAGGVSQGAGGARAIGVQTSPQKRHDAPQPVTRSTTLPRTCSFSRCRCACCTSASGNTRSTCTRTLPWSISRPTSASCSASGCAM